MIIACKIGLTTVLMLSFASGISIAEPHPQPLSLSRRGEFESNHTKAEQLSQQALEKYQANEISEGYFIDKSKEYSFFDKSDGLKAVHCIDNDIPGFSQ